MDNLRKRRGGVAVMLALLGFMAGSAAAQETGRIVGRVLDAETGQALSSVQVYISDGSYGALTSLDGRYVIRSVPAGTYDVTAQNIGYGTKTVTGVTVSGGQSTELDITLTSQAVQLEELVITSEAQRGSTTALLTERKLSAVVSDGIGADQISRSPDGDAAAALKRVPGLSVVDGKYAYVRGLGERYSATTLNGAPLASPEPDKKVIPLDLIPSDLLQSIVTSKSYSPDQPGDYAGGLVQLETRDFPSNRIFNIGVSAGWNSVATRATGLGYAGGDLDFLGFDDGSRGLPGLIPSDLAVTRSNFSDTQLEAMGEAFGGDWGPTPRKLPFNGGLGLSYGDDFNLGESQRAGFIASVNYSADQSLRANSIERVFAASGVDDPEVDYRGTVAEQAVTVGGLLNFTYQPRPTDQVKLATVYNHQSSDVARIYEGFNLDSSTDQWNSQLQYLEQTLVNGQLEGEHLLGFLADATLSWRGALTRASRYEPSTREALYQEFDGDYIWDDFIQSGSVFHQDMVDDGWSAGGALKLPFELGDTPGSFSVGGSTDRKDRTAFTRRFRFRPRGDLIDSEARMLGPNELFTDQYIDPDGFVIQEATFRTDNYDAQQEVDAGYAMLDMEVVDGLRVSGGARVEQSLQTVSPKDLWDVGGLDPVEGAERESTDVLPALNVTVQLSETMNLRASASRTLARAQLRELAPFSFADYAGGYLVIGNPSLSRSRIDNYDLRYEWFGGPQTVFAVSTFYKKFDDPIEVSVLPSSELLKTWVNADGADNYGVELEVRSDLGFLSGGLESLSVNGNLTLVQSEVTNGSSIRVYLPGTGETDLAVVSTNRALQGQSPYVANAGLTWAPLDGGLTATVLFNRFGRRIDAVGGQATPDIYEEARSQLDAVVEWPIRGGWRAKLSASRLIGNEVEFTQGGGLLRSYDLGRSVSLGVSWGIGR
ncbi:MAG: carboxypeptidase regulatory-like domain-containing protein [Longimicrobiales bacterium]|nr:carboxypeptidase regulatory-like domain-containing protein [Longimicrobiales bacterium]